MPLLVLAEPQGRVVVGALNEKLMVAASSLELAPTCSATRAPSGSRLTALSEYTPTGRLAQCEPRGSLYGMARR